MRRLILLLALVPSFLLSGCVDEQEQDNTPEGNFHALWTLLDQRYCFFDYKGVDWAAVRSKHQARVRPQMTNAQLFEVLTDMLSELQDGHVNLYTAGDIARYWHWYEDYPKNWDQELRDAYLGRDYMIASSLKYRILNDNIGYVVCESFNSGMGEGNIDQMLYNLRACDGLIIDVRGNGGGQLTNAERLASHFTNEKRLVGYTMHKTGPAHNAFSEPRASYLAPSEGVRWQKACIVLTNRECYSACNIFVRDMMQCPGVLVLGDRTGGGSGMPFSSELPNGWQVRYSAEPSLDINRQHIEFGIDPDEKCSLDSVEALNGYDTLIETARRIIRSGKR